MVYIPRGCSGLYKGDPVTPDELERVEPFPVETLAVKRSFVYAPGELEVPYSAMQTDAYVDSCLYNHSYGFCTGEQEHIDNWLKVNGYNPDDYNRIRMDDKRSIHVLQLKDNYHAG